MPTNWQNKPQTLESYDIEDLIRQHGKIRGLRRLDDPTKHPLDRLETSVYTFEDGTSITLEMDPTTGQSRVIDYGGVGNAIDDQAKMQEQASNDWTTQQIGQAVYRINKRTGETQKIMDVPLSQYEQAQIQAMQANKASKQEQAYTDYQSTIEFLKKEVAAGRMTPQQASAALVQSRNAALKGSTPMEMDQLASNNAGIGAGMLNQRVSSGTSMANSLVGATLDAVKLGAGPGNFNPFALAKNFVTDLGGGQQTYDTAASLVNNLQSQVGQGEENPLDPSYWSGSDDNPGDAGVQDDFEMPQFGAGFNWQYPDGNGMPSGIPPQTVTPPQMPQFGQGFNWQYPDNVPGFSIPPLPMTGGGGSW